jgi:hypothetical protein
VWEHPTVSSEWLGNRLAKFFNKSLKRYYYNEKFMVMNGALYSQLQTLSIGSSEQKNSFFNIFDFERLFLSYKHNDKIMSPMRIREAYDSGVKFGIKYSRTQSYLIFPIDKNHCIKINTDWRKNIFGILPLGQGLNAYFKHLDKEGLLDGLLEPKKKEVRNQMRAILAAQAIEVERPDEIPNRD